MPRNEIAALFRNDGQWDALDPAEQLFAGRLLERRFALHFRVTDLDDLRGSDPLGPWFRIGLQLDRLSGPESRWVGVDELVAVLDDDLVLAKWISEIATAAAVDRRVVIEQSLDTWCELILTESVASATIIDTAYVDAGPVWRSLPLLREPQPPDVNRLVDHLIDHHDGTLQTDAAGRAHVSLDDVEVFIGTELDPEVTQTTLVEAPIRISVLCGIELRPDSGVDRAVQWFRTDPARPRDLSITLTRGIGDQVWVDRSLSPAVMARLAPTEAVDELLAHARRLGSALRPWEQNPPERDRD